MLRSMTGFGSATLERDGLGLSCEVRSVNHRHLAVRVKGPSELSAHEIALEKVVKAKLERGSVTVSLRLERGGALAAASIHSDLVRHYAAELDQLASELGKADRGVSLDRILSLPGVIGTESGDQWKDQAKALSDECLAAALADLVTMREREGVVHAIAAAPALSTDGRWVSLPPSQLESAPRFTPHALATSVCDIPSLAMRARTRAASAALYGGGSAAVAGVGRSLFSWCH